MLRRLGLQRATYWHSDKAGFVSRHRPKDAAEKVIRDLDAIKARLNIMGEA